VVDILFTITNLGWQPVRFETIMPPPLNLRATKGDTTVWMAFEPGGVHDPAPDLPGITISAGELTELRYDWALVDELGAPVGPGSYDIEGLLCWSAVPVLGDGGDIIEIFESGYIVGVRIEVVPEPATFGIILLTSALLLSKRRSARCVCGEKLPL
jgi:hypothetical protein